MAQWKRACHGCDPRTFIAVIARALASEGVTGVFRDDYDRRKMKNLKQY